MTKTVLAAVLIITGFLASAGETAQAASAMAAGYASQAFMPVGARTSQPIGHYEFCRRAPEECGPETGSAMRVRLDEAKWAALISVNDAVNTGISPVTDREAFGQDEFWTYPTSIGDCEDFVLLKRRMLVEQGWPAAALLITVVRQPNGDGHAVLTVRTDRGDLVLDNLEAKVLVWNRTEYRFVKRQSDINAGQWVAISDGRANLVGSLSR